MFCKSLSTEINNMCEISYGNYAIQIVSVNLQGKISDFVRETIRDKGLSYRKVAANSGGLITHSTVSDVINERVSNLSSKTIEGLAKGLGVPEEKIFAFVRGENLSTSDVERIEIEAMYRKRKSLSPARKEAFKRILDMVDRELDRLYEEEQKEKKNKKISN